MSEYSVTYPELNVRHKWRGHFILPSQARETKQEMTVTGYKTSLIGELGCRHGLFSDDGSGCLAALIDYRPS